MGDRCELFDKHAVILRQLFDQKMRGMSFVDYTLALKHPLDRAAKIAGLPRRNEDARLSGGSIFLRRVPRHTKTGVGGAAIRSAEQSVV